MRRDADGMPGTDRTANLPAGAPAPAPGINLVTHRDPPHALPHEVTIVALMLLPRCNACANVRFSLRSYLIEPIEENEFFRTGR